MNEINNKIKWDAHFYILFKFKTFISIYFDFTLPGSLRTTIDMFSTVGMTLVRISTSWEWHVNHGVRWTTNFIYIFVYSTDPRSLLTLHSCDIKRKVSWNMIRKQSTHTFNMVIINLATCTLCRKYRMVQDHLHFYIWFWLKINRKL